MTVDPEKIAHLIPPSLSFAGKGELRREKDVFFIGEGLPPRETLETIFDSDSLAPAALFCFAFSGADAFSRTEALVRGVKKNFRGYLLGRFAISPPPPLLDRAYAAGIDLVDLPLPAVGRQERFALLDYAQTVFPRWSVLVTLPTDRAPLEELQRDIDLLLDRGILPLITLTPAAASQPPAEVTRLFDYQLQGWRRARATLLPLQPLLRVATPLATPQPRGFGALLGKAREAQLRTASDLRRLLRVRQMEDSFESAGL